MEPPWGVSSSNCLSSVDDCTVNLITTAPKLGVPYNGVYRGYIGVYRAYIGLKF